MVNGLLGRKVGQTRIFSDDGRSIPVTLLETGPCHVVQRKTTDTDGYEAVQIGFDDRKEQRCTKPELGHFKKAGVTPKRHLREFDVDAASELKAGDLIAADIFAAGERVDVTGQSKGRGFQGMHKRHGAKGGPGGHGSHFHRAPGSIGQSADPAKVYKGKTMPGQMGNRRVTVQNLEIVQVDSDKNIIVVRGAVPGAVGGLVVVKKRAKGTV